MQHREHATESHLELQELGDAGVDVAAPLDGVDNGVEVVVQQQNVRRLLRDARAARHRETDIG